MNHCIKVTYKSQQLTSNILSSLHTHIMFVYICALLAAPHKFVVCLTNFDDVHNKITFYVAFIMLLIVIGKLKKTFDLLSKKRIDYEFALWNSVLFSVHFR